MIGAKFGGIGFFVKLQPHPKTIKDPIYSHGFVEEKASPIPIRKKVSRLIKGGKCKIKKQ